MPDAAVPATAPAYALGRDADNGRESAMTVSLGTLGRAMSLVDHFADLHDPAGYADVVLPDLQVLTQRSQGEAEDVG